MANAKRPKLARCKNIKLHPKEIIPASIPIKEDIGKSGLMWPRGLAKLHPAAPLLDEYNSNGCPVNIGEAWSTEHIIQALKQGPHVSAKDPLPAKVLRQETMDKVKESFAKIVKWKDIKKMCLQTLRSLQLQ